MNQEEFINYLFPGDKLTNYLDAQPSHRQWMETLKNKLKPIHMYRGEMLSIGGKIPDGIYFLDKGAVKGYQYYEGRKQVYYLWSGPSVIGDITNFIQETTSDLYIEIVQDSSLFKLERSELTNVFFEFPESFLFLNSIQLNYLSYYKERYHDLHTLEPFEIFEKLLSTRKGIDLIFSKSDLASFLGISRSSICAYYRRKN